MQKGTNGQRSKADGIWSVGLFENIPFVELWFVIKWSQWLDFDDDDDQMNSR